MPSHAHLPSLLRNLTSASTRSTASVSLDSPSSSTISSNDDTRSLASHSSSRSKSARRMRVVTDPVVTKSQDYPTTSSKPPHSTTAKDGKGKGKEREIETASEGARSRSSSGSSFEGLTARLQGARQGKKRSVEKRDDAEENDDSEGKSGDRVKHVQEEEEESFYNQRQTELSSVPTISLSVDQVEIQHGETKVVTPDLSEPPPPLSVPTPIDSPVLSAHSSNFDSRPPPPHRIKINENEPDDDKGPSATTFASSPSLSELSDAGDDDDEGGRSESESEPESVNLVSRSESQQDPRELLRSQLAKAGTGRQEGRTGEEIREEQEAEQKIRVAMNRTASGISQRSHTGMEKEMGPGKEIKVYDKRRDEDEDMASGLVGVMQAIVSIFADEGDKIRCVEVGDSKITFLLKSPLYLVVSSSWGEPESVLRTHLDYLYLQVLSVVTLTQLQSIFSRRSNFDLRRMMEGTEPFFHSLVNSLQTSTPILTSSMEVYRLDPNVRSEIAKALDPGREVTKQLDLLYVLLLARGRLVTLLRPKKHSIHPTDLHLLLSTIYSSSPRSKSTASTSVKEPGSEAQTSGEGDEWRNSPLTEPGLESWLPICLPRFNPKGFLHAYVSFLNLPNSTTPASPSNPTASGGGGGGIGLVLLSSDRDGFIAVKEAAEGIKDRLLSSHGRDFTVSAGSNGRSKNRKGGKAGGGLIHEIEKARILQEYSLVELAIPGLRHFVYKSRSLVQSTRPAWEGDYLALSDRYKLITLYQHLADSLHPRPAQTGTPAKRPAQVQYLRTEQEAVLGWSTPQFELYVATSPLLPHSAVVSAAKRISKWVEKEEQKLFLTSSPSF